MRSYLPDRMWENHDCDPAIKALFRKNSGRCFFHIRAFGFLLFVCRDGCASVRRTQPQNAPDARFLSYWLGKVKSRENEGKQEIFFMHISKTAILWYICYRRAGLCAPERKNGPDDLQMKEEPK